jgi:N-acetylmuramoyl-L-alanine amidase
VEGKFVRMRASAQTRMQEIAFNEANLTLATALALQEKLIAQGAEVLLTRSAPGMSAMGIGYSEWRETQFSSSIQYAIEIGLIDSAEAKYFRTKATEKEIFINLFNRLDLLARAKMINTFHPDLTMILHYNVDSKNWEQRDAEGYMYSGSENYCMAFVPGSFMFGELEKPVDRLAFLRLLITDDLAASTNLSGKVVEQFEKKLHVPPVKQSQQLTYLQNACIPIGGPGVFARNLTLTRLVYGPLCYGESLCQDHIIEAQALNKKDAEVAGIPASSRVIEVADAYYEGVMRYLGKG